MRRHDRGGERYRRPGCALLRGLPGMEGTGQCGAYRRVPAPAAFRHRLVRDVLSHRGSGDDQRRDVARGAGHARHTGGADIGFAGIPATEGRFGSRGPQARGQGLVSGRRGV